MSSLRIGRTDVSLSLLLYMSLTRGSLHKPNHKIKLYLDILHALDLNKVVISRSTEPAEGVVQWNIGGVNVEALLDLFPFQVLHGGSIQAEFIPVSIHQILLLEKKRWIAIS